MIVDIHTSLVNATFITMFSTDKEYLITKLIKQGKETMNPHFEELAGWIYQNYGVKPLNIIYEKVLTAGGVLRPRLEIIFEFLRDTDMFRPDPQFYFSYDEEKLQNIRGEFERELIAKDDALKKIFFNLFGRRVFSPYEINGLFIILSDFESAAKDEARSCITKDEMEDLKTEINNPNLWLISNSIFFFYTNNQIETYSLNGLKHIMADKYFNILKKYDEFDYFKRDNFTINLDSKENFDNNYESNWFYYYR